MPTSKMYRKVDGRPSSFYEDVAVSVTDSSTDGGHARTYAEVASSSQPSRALANSVWEEQRRKTREAAEAARLEAAERKRQDRVRVCGGSSQLSHPKEGVQSEAGRSADRGRPDLNLREISHISLEIPKDKAPPPPVPWRATQAARRSMEALHLEPSAGSSGDGPIPPKPERPPPGLEDVVIPKKPLLPLATVVKTAGAPPVKAPVPLPKYPIGPGGCLVKASPEYVPEPKYPIGPGGHPVKAPPESKQGLSSMTPPPARAEAARAAWVGPKSEAVAEWAKDATSHRHVTEGGTLFGTKGKYSYYGRSSYNRSSRLYPGIRTWP